MEHFRFRDQILENQFLDRPVKKINPVIFLTCHKGEG